jgi:hypothetical protein
MLGYRKNIGKFCSLSTAVLCIRIRKNPKLLAGSKSEKKFGFGFVSRNCFKIKTAVKNRRSNTLKGKKLTFFSWKTYFSVVQIPEHI